MKPCLSLIIVSVIVATTAPAQNLLQNPGFESGLTGWAAWGPDLIDATNTLAHSGTYSVIMRNRTDTWNGVVQSLLGAMQTGTSYTVSAWVRLANTNSQTAMLTMQKVDGGGTTYQNIATGTVNSNGWTQLVGAYTLTTSGSLTALNLYIEGPAAGVNFYADDFVVQSTGDWKTAANARIEQIRKRDVHIQIVDPAGNPVSGASLDARQTRHAFGFGSAINGNISNPSYAAFFRTNFEWAVMENESKWYANEPSQGNVTYAAADSITNYCYTNGIILRGHNIFWAVDQWVQSWVTNLSNANLLIAVTNRLNSVVNHFKGTFVHWDVNNEMLHGNFYGNRLGNWVNPWMFQYAHSLASNAVLFVNDYNIVSGNETEAYKQQILSLLASNAPVQAIGDQAHFGSVIDPAVTESRLDSLAQLNLPIWFTEYDSLNSDEFVRASNLETLYRLAFSKQSVEGVIMWGFWAGSHWRGSNAAIVNLNWSLNEAGRRYQSLLNEWTTRTNGTSGAGGTYDFRGFQGSYDITVTPPGGLPTLRRVTLDPVTNALNLTLVVAPYGAQPVLHNASVSAADNAFRSQLTGDAGRAYQIQTSSNLIQWAGLTTVSNTTGTLWFTNSNPAPDQRFYRARLLP